MLVVIIESVLVPFVFFVMCASILVHCWFQDVTDIYCNNEQNTLLFFMLVVVTQSVLVLTVFWFTVDFRTSAGTAVIEDLCVCHTGGDCPECTCAIFFGTCVSILVPSSLLISGYHRVPWWCTQDLPVLHSGGVHLRHTPACSLLETGTWLLHETQGMSALQCWCHTCYGEIF